MEKSVFMEQLIKHLEVTDRQTVRIIGHGASGKSCLAAALVAALGDRVNLLETDTYMALPEYRQLVIPKAFPDQKVTASLPIGHELKSLKRDILALQQGLSVMTIDEPWSKSRLLSSDKPIILVEGMGASFLPADLFDMTIACFTDGETELKRRLHRDTKERQRAQTFVVKGHEVRRQQYHYYLEPIIKKADILIDQSQNDFKVTFQKSFEELRTS